MQETISFEIFVSPKSLTRCGFFHMIGFVHAHICTCGTKRDEIIRLEHAASLFAERSFLSHFVRNGRITYRDFDNMVRAIGIFLQSMASTTTTTDSDDKYPYPDDFERVTETIQRTYVTSNDIVNCKGQRDSMVHAQSGCTCIAPDLIRSTEDILQYEMSPELRDLTIQTLKKLRS